jgi:hypothetical protein
MKAYIYPINALTNIHPKARQLMSLHFPLQQNGIYIYTLRNETPSYLLDPMMQHGSCEYLSEMSAKGRMKTAPKKLR